MSTSTTRTAKRKEPLRFAHPFFTNTPPATRTPTPHGTRMVDHIKGTLNKIPAVKGKSVMTLADIIGAKSASDIEQRGRLLFHSTGDTGKGADSPQGDVAAAMTTDFNIDKPNESPAFFLHLGDVIYNHTKDQNYRQEFYEPYMHYPGKIVAIPGNHDGEVFSKTDPVTLHAFLANFCAPSAQVPPVAGSIFRETMTQPGVFWLLDAPFIHIIGLYSNSAENPGFISGTIPGQTQKNWLVKVLKAIAKGREGGARKHLLFATHHPPFSSAGHSGSTEMLNDIDDACRQAAIMPDIFLSGHSHTFQRYTRRMSFGGKNIAIPFIVCGIGGFNAQTIAPATGQIEGDHTLEKTHEGYGYLLIDVSKTQIVAMAFGVDAQRQKQEFDRVTLTI